MMIKVFGRLLVVALVLLSLGSCRQKPSKEQSYLNCMRKQVKMLEKKQKKDGPTEKMKDLRENQADEICREILNECEEEPNGFRCAQLIKRYRSI